MTSPKPLAPTKLLLQSPLQSFPFFSADHLLVLGGRGAGAHVEQLSLSGASTLCPSPVPPLPTAVHYHSTMITDRSRLLSCGGWSDRTNRAISSCWTWTPDIKTWTPAPSLPAARATGQMVLVQNNVLWLGGHDGSSRGQIYSLDSGVLGQQWEEVASMVTPRDSHCSVAYDNFVITAGITTLTLWAVGLLRVLTTNL